MINCMFVGDVMPGAEAVHETSSRLLLHEFSQCDVVLGNLESPIVSKPPELFNRQKIPLWSTSKNIETLNDFNFTHFCLNNNHAYDLYDAGLYETAEQLRSSGIKGFGLNHGSMSQIDCIEKDDIKIGLLAVNWVQSDFTAHLSKQLSDIDISKARQQFDFLLCFMHWGDDHNIYINRDQQKTARWLIERGVDLVIGHHPHVPQGHEVYKNRHIFYSLGNFIFTPEEKYPYLPYRVRYDDQRENLLFRRKECKIGLIVRVLFLKKSFLVTSVQPVYRRHTLPSPFPGNLYPAYHKLKEQMDKQVALGVFCKE